MTTTEPSPEKPSLQWRWMRPDRPGIWAMSVQGKHQYPTESGVHCLGHFFGSLSEAWRCFICDMPEISPPPNVKQTITQVLCVHASEQKSLVQTRWFDSDEPLPEGWHTSELTREVEEPQQ